MQTSHGREPVKTEAPRFLFLVGLVGEGYREKKAGAFDWSWSVTQICCNKRQIRDGIWYAMQGEEPLCSQSSEGTDPGK